MTLGEIAAATGGTLSGGDSARAVSGFSIDTRTLQPGDLYFAIRGDRFDGHAFVDAAMRGGAAGAVIGDPAAAVRQTTRLLRCRRSAGTFGGNREPGWWR
jgi:UDP-N-acetylmuramyl pentapeptide synthase